MAIVRWLVPLLLVGPGRGHAGTTEDIQLWALQSLGVALNKRVTIVGDMHERGVDRVQRLGNVLLRATILYRVNKRLTLASGYTHNATLRAGRPANLENNVFQQLFWEAGRIGRVEIKGRTWFEQRWVTGTEDTGYRLRQRVRLELPVGQQGNVRLIVSDEQLFNLNSTDWGASGGLDQSRNFVGVNLALANGVTIETGYLNRYQRRRGRPDRLDHIIPLGLSLRF